MLHYAGEYGTLYKSVGVQRVYHVVHLITLVLVEYNNVICFPRTNTADPVVFTLTPPECFMEIRSGYGTTGQSIQNNTNKNLEHGHIIYIRQRFILLI